MVAMLMDSVLLLLLVFALGYGVRLERKLKALREGQLAFAGAVTELNTAAGRAENALASLRAASQETDLLHDRIVKAREARDQLEALLGRADSRLDAPRAETPIRPVASAAVEPLRPSAPVAQPEPAVVDPDRFASVLQALAAGRAAKESLNRARRSLDSDLFAA